MVCTSTFQSISQASMIRSRALNAEFAFFPIFNQFTITTHKSKYSPAPFSFMSIYQHLLLYNISNTVFCIDTNFQIVCMHTTDIFVLCLTAVIPSAAMGCPFMDSAYRYGLNFAQITYQLSTKGNFHAIIPLLTEKGGSCHG